MWRLLLTILLCVVPEVWSVSDRDAYGFYCPAAMIYRTTINDDYTDELLFLLSKRCQEYMTKVMSAEREDMKRGIYPDYYLKDMMFIQDKIHKVLNHNDTSDRP